MKLKYVLILAFATSMLLSCQDDNELTLNKNLKVNETNAAVATALPAPKAPAIQKLTSVDLYLTKDARASGTVTVNIIRRASNAVIGSSTMNVSDINGWTKFAFSTPLSIREGQYYIIEVSCSKPGANGTYVWWHTAGSTYRHGDPKVNGEAFSSDFDFSFITYKKVTVTPPVVGPFTIIVPDQVTSYDPNVRYAVNAGLTNTQGFLPGASK